MKKVILTTLLTFVFLATANLAFAQQEVVQDFESSPSVTGFEGLTSATIVADPSEAGNGQVLELITSAAGNPWQGAEVVLADDSALDITSDLTVSVDVWSDVAFSPMAKVETTGNAADAPVSANTQSHSGSGWETLTFTFNTGDDGTATADGIYNKVVFFPNRSADGTAWDDPEDGTFYFDNITGVKGTVGTAPPDNPPTTAAPTPPSRDAENVISLFSNAYDDITVDAWSAEWDDSDIEDVVIDGNDTKKISFGNFIGVDFASNPFDASEMTHFHIDFWTSETELTGKVFNSKWSNHENGEGETNAYDFTYELTGDESGQWVSLDVPLSEANIVTNADASAFAQFLITSNLGVVYVDNIYLYNETSTSIEDGTEVPEGFALKQNYPNPFNPTTNISYNIPQSGEVTLEVFNIQGQRVATLVDAFQSSGSYTVTFDASQLASGLYTYRLSNGNSVQVKKMMLIK